MIVDSTVLNKKSLKYLFLFLACSISVNIYSQFTPFFQNYSTSEYLAAQQNWDVSAADDGRIYVANNQGLLEYDGLVWKLHEMPNKTIIRSVLSHKNRVYVGSYEEFGFWERDQYGSLKYSSLSQKIEKHNFNNQEFWEILNKNDTILFRSFSGLYFYQTKSKKIININTGFFITRIALVKGQFYLSCMGKGILRFNLKEKKFHTLLGTEKLKDANVQSLIEYKGNLLIGTASKGCFVYKNQKIEPWHGEINDLLKTYQLNNIQVLQNEQLVFGTIKDGLYITTQDGKVLFHLNKKNGLLNNTILRIRTDINQNIWVALDNGLAEINMSGKILAYNDAEGNLGSVYDAALHNEKIYFGSNTGIYFVDQSGLNFVKGSQGQVWDLETINNQLVCGHNNGTYLLKNNKLELLSSYTGGWTIKQTPKKEKIYIQGTYTGLVRYNTSKVPWEVSKIKMTILPIRSLVFENENTAWIAHAYKGLYRVKFDKEYNQLEEFVSYEKKGLPSVFNPKINKIKNTVVFATNKGWYRYEPLQDTIIPYQFLNQMLGNDSLSYLITEKSVNFELLKSEKGILLMKNQKGDFNPLFLDEKYYKNRLVLGNERAVKLNDEFTLLTLKDGALLLHNLILRDPFETLEKPQLEKIIYNEKLQNISSTSFSFPYQGSRRLEIIASSPKSRNYFYQYKLSPVDKKWHVLNENKIILNNLSDKDYQLQIKIRGLSGNESDSQNIRFSISPPWYRSSFMLTIYMLCVAGLIYGLFMLYRYYLKRRLHYKNLLKIRKERLENEKKLIMLENEKLEMEVKLKNKELSNSSMAMIKKNEFLKEIKSKLIELEKSNHIPLSKNKEILRLIDKNAESSNEWEIFEKNFNQVHESFLKRLKQQFTELTSNDLRLCAYLKMGLSSKEIAPLQNITVRSVEIHRYRLRKKLNISKKESLADFLMAF